MVKIGLDIKNGSKAFKPKKGDVVIFDGKEWYVTTKEDIFAEYERKVDEKLQEVTDSLRKIENYKQEISEQVIAIGEAVRDFMKLQGDK